MTSREVAQWLNNKATDEEYAEVFAYLYYAMNGRGVPETLTADMMRQVKVAHVTNVINQSVDEIIYSESDVCQGAWWKNES